MEKNAAFGVETTFLWCHDSDTLASEGRWILERRERLGWGQPELAKRARVGLNTVVKAEHDRNVWTIKKAAILAALDAAEKEQGLTSLVLDTRGQDRLGSAHPRQSLEIVRAPDPIRQGDAYQSDFPRGADAPESAADARIRELERQLDAEKAAHAEMRGLAARLTDIIATRLENLETRLAQAGSRKRR